MTLSSAKRRPPSTIQAYHCSDSVSKDGTFNELVQFMTTVAWDDDPLSFSFEHEEMPKKEKRGEAAHHHMEPVESDIKVKLFVAW